MTNRERAKDLLSLVWNIDQGDITEEQESVLIKVTEFLDEAEKRGYRNGQEDGFKAGSEQTFQIQKREAFVKGQRDMRERAANWFSGGMDNKASKDYLYAKAIRALPIEGE